MIAMLLALFSLAPADKVPPLPNSIDGLPVGAIPQQKMPEHGCAAFLWSAGATHALVAMVSAEPAQARLSIDGRIADYPRVSQAGIGGYGFARTMQFGAAGTTITLDMTVEEKADLQRGAVVSNGTLQYDRAGKDLIVLPVAGLIGCA